MKLNWSQLISDISEVLIMNQTDLGKAIGTTQQSISNWLNGRREPSEPNAQKLLELAEQAGIDVAAGIYLGIYKLSKKEKRKQDKKQEFKALPLNIRKLVLTISKLSIRKRNSTVRYLEDMMDR